MAIDRKDYQYIHNSLGKNSIASNDNSLKVGSKVKNLLIELKEENIWNGDFQDYYGNQPSEYWEPFSTKGATSKKAQRLKDAETGSVNKLAKGISRSLWLES